MNPANASEFLAELADGIPAMPRAACRGRPQLFVSDRPRHTAQAAEVCSTCLELTRVVGGPKPSRRKLFSALLPGTDISTSSDPTTKEKTPMTEYHLPGDRIPDGLWMIPTEAQCGHGYIAETGEDAIVLTMVCEGGGVANSAIRPDLAMQLSAMLAMQCMNLRRINGEADDIDTEGEKE